MFPINRRKWMTLSGAAFALRGTSAGARQAPAPGASQPTPDELLLKDYRPQPIFKIPKTDIKKAKYPVIDVHSHGPRPIEQLPEFVKTMDAANVEKTVILTGANSVERFAEINVALRLKPNPYFMRKSNGKPQTITVSASLSALPRAWRN